MPNHLHMDAHRRKNDPRYYDSYEEEDGEEFLTARASAREKPQKRQRQVEDGETQHGPSADGKGTGTDAADEKLDKVLRELGKVREQNALTHGLLWALVLVTAAWHASELSLLLSARNKLFHPLQAIRGLVSACVSGLWRRIRRVERGLVAASSTDPSSYNAAPAGGPQIEVSPLPPMVAVPEMAHPGLPTLTLNPAPVT